jgi:murein L,D-transpeptidase YcbB/YkuD
MDFFKLLGAATTNAGRIKRTYELIQPILALYLANAKEIETNVTMLAEAFGVTHPEAKSSIEIPARYDVKWIQRQLNKYLGTNLDLDGDYGTATKDAVSHFQKRQNLPVDGWVGPATAEKLEQVK